MRASRRRAREGRPSPSAARPTRCSSSTGAGWFKQAFKYVIHYADGKDVEIPVNSTNMIDWVSEPVDRFPDEAGTFTTVAETVKVPQFNHGSVYRMEWGAPLDRRAVEIKSIEFIGDGKCVPILLGITGVMEW